MTATDKPDSRRAQALDVIKRHPRGIRSAELAAALGCRTKQVHASVAPLIRSGEVVSCKVTTDQGETVEFRLGQAAGTPMPKGDSRAFVVNARRAAGNPIVARPKEQFRPAEGVAQPAGDAAPKPPPTGLEKVADTLRRMGIECVTLREVAPGPARAAAQGSQIVIRRLSLDSDAHLRLALDDGNTLVLDPAGVLTLGDFLICCEGVWRP